MSTEHATPSPIIMPFRRSHSPSSSHTSFQGIVAIEQPMYQTDEPSSKKEKKGSFFGKLLSGKKPSIEASDQPLYQNDDDSSGKKKKVFAQSSKKPIVNDNEELYEYSNEISKQAPAEDIYGYDNDAVPADKVIGKKADNSTPAKAVKPDDGEEIYGYDNAVVPADKLPNAAEPDAAAPATGISDKEDYNEGQELYGYDNDKVPESKIVSPPAAAAEPEPVQSSSSYAQQSYNNDDEDSAQISSFSSPAQVTDNSGFSAAADNYRTAVETKKARDPSPDGVAIDPATVLPAEALFPSVFATRRAFNVEKKEVTLEEARLARAEKAKAAAAEAKKKAEQLKYEQEQEILRQQSKVVIKAKKNSLAAIFEPQVITDPRAAVIAAKNVQPVVKPVVKPVPKSSNPQEFDVSSILKKKSAAETLALEEQLRREEELRVAREKAKQEMEENERRKQEREALKRSLQAAPTTSPVKVLQNSSAPSAKPGITLKPVATAASKASPATQSSPAKQIEPALEDSSTDDSNIDPKKIKKESSGKGTLERIKESFNTIRRKKMRQGGTALERLTAVMPFNDPRYMLVDRGEEFDILRRFPDGTVSARRVDTGETGLLPGDIFIAMDSLF